MPNLLTHLNIGDQKTTINSVHYIVGTGSTAGTWLGTDSSINEYYDGLTIAYKIPVKGASTTTLNITGAAGTALGAKTVYRNGSSKITTHYGVGSVVLLVYTTDSSNVGSWQCVDYDSDTTYSSKAAASGGTDLSLVTTGEKYTWNNKQNAITTSNKLAASYISGLATVATSGSYNDLTNKPTIPSAYSLPTASSSKKGGIKVGTGLSMSSETMNLASHATNATTYGAGTTSNYGHVKIQNGDLHTKTHTDGVAAGLAHTHSLYFTTAEAEALDLRKQEKLESGTNIKTINGNSILGSGNITISAGGADSEKVKVSKVEHRDDSTKYYKIGLISPGNNNTGGNLSVTSAEMAYLPGLEISSAGYMMGSSLKLSGSLFVGGDSSSSAFMIDGTNRNLSCAGNLTIGSGYYLKLNKIYAPTASGGSEYGTGSSGKVLKSNGTTVYWGDDNNTTYTFNGAVSTIKDSNLTANRALISNGSGKVAVSSVTSTQLGYLSGVTSNIQTQLNAKGTSNLTIGTTSTTAAAGNHTHSNYLTQSTADARYALKSEIGGGGTTSVQILTRAEYNALTTISSDVLYIVRG